MSLGQGGGAMIGLIIGAILAAPTGGMSLMAGAMLGASLGSAVGGVANAFLFPPKQKLDGPASLNMQTSQYGFPIPFIGGERIVTGNCIWYGNFQSHKQESLAGKGLGAGGAGGAYYTYTVSLAFGVAINSCDIVEIKIGNRIYPLGTNGQLWYDGTQTQPDNHIQEIFTAEGKTRIPVWKGLTYIVLPNVDLGTSTVVPIFTFKVTSKATSYMQASSGGVYPNEVIMEALRNPFYGLGLAVSAIDTTSFDAVGTYCATNETRISPVLSKQQNILDFMQYIMTHHNGLIAYSQGKIAYIQLSEEQVITALLAEDSFVKTDGNPYLTIVDKGDKEIFNNITLHYTKLDGTTGIVYASDIVDIENNGLKNTTLNLDSLTSALDASRMAQIFLNKSISNPKIITGKLGLNSLEGIKIGRCVNVVDEKTSTDKIILVTQLVINLDYTVDFEGIEEFFQNYNVVAIDSEVVTGVLLPNFSALAPSVLRTSVIEMPANYSRNPKYFVNFSAVDSINWINSVLYKSYSPTSEYSIIDRNRTSGVTGLVIGTGLSNDIAYIDVTLDSNFILESALSLDSLMITPDLNLCGFVSSGAPGVSIIFIRYEVVTLITGTTWRLSGLIYNIIDVPKLNTFGTIVTGDSFFLVSKIPYSFDIKNSELNKTMYFKPASVNAEGVEQVLGEITATAITVTGKSYVPLMPTNITVNGIGVGSTNEVTVGTGDITLTWQSRNRYFDGMTDFENTDSTYDDTEFKHFAIKIYHNANLLRTVTQTEKTFVYTSAMQASDGSFSSYNVKVRQKNTAFNSQFSDLVSITLV